MYYLNKISLFSWIDADKIFFVFLDKNGNRDKNIKRKREEKYKCIDTHIIVNVRYVYI